MINLKHMMTGGHFMCETSTGTYTAEWSNVTCPACWVRYWSNQPAKEPEWEDDEDREEEVSVGFIVFDPVEALKELDEDWHVNQHVIFDTVEYVIVGLTNDFGTATLERVLSPGVWGVNKAPQITVALSFLEPAPEKAKVFDSFREPVADGFQTSRSNKSKRGVRKPFNVLRLLKRHNAMKVQ